MKKDLVSIADLTKEEIVSLFYLARELKERRKRGEKVIPLLSGKVLGLLFSKPSTRTRISFEVGMAELGGRSIYLQTKELQVSRGETIEDTGKVFSLYLDGLVIRTFQQEELIRFAKAATIPVINGLTDLLHPCQALSDYFTLWEKRGEVSGLNLLYLGDGNNVCHSLILGADKLGVNLYISTPEGYEPKEEILKKVNKERIKISHNPEDFLSKAEVIYTDTWVSMGEEEERKKRLKVFKGFQVNRDLINKAGKEVLIMHCLPAHRGEEITSEILDSPSSIVFLQAENRLHFQKAILATLL